MPLHDYRCPACARLIEDRLSRLGEAPSTIECPTCGGRAVRLAGKVACTPGRWGDSHPQFIPALGGHIPNSRAFDRACEERGLVPVTSDVQLKMERNMEANRRANDETIRVTRAIEARAAELGPSGDPVARAEATSEILSPAYLEHEARHGDTMRGYSLTE